MQPSVHVAFTLRPDKRTPGDIARIREIAVRLGLEPSGGSLATLSFRAEPDVVAKIFKTTVHAVPERPPGESDFGAAPGFSATLPARVPSELSEFVETVSVVPPARRFM